MGLQEYASKLHASRLILKYYLSEKRKTNMEQDFRPATLSNCGNPLKPLIPPYDREIRNGTPGKLGKTICYFTNRGMVKKQRIDVEIQKMGNPQLTSL